MTPTTLKTFAADAVEDGLYAAKRSITHRVRDLVDLREAAVHQIRRAPFSALVVTLGAGILLGLAAGWSRNAIRSHRP